MKKNNKGFTLAELLIVVAVIAVLVAVAIPTFGSQLEKARQATDVANLRDAYAIAKVAILNQEDGEWKTLFTTLSTNSKTEAYCNPDTGKISSQFKRTCCCLTRSTRSSCFGPRAAVHIKKKLLCYSH